MREASPPRQDPNDEPRWVHSVGPGGLVYGVLTYGRHPVGVVAPQDVETHFGDHGRFVPRRDGIAPEYARAEPPESEREGAPRGGPLRTAPGAAEGRTRGEG